MLLVFLFQNLRTTDSVLIILIVVVLIAATTGIEILVPRVVLWIDRVLGRAPIVASIIKGV